MQPNLQQALLLSTIIISPALASTTKKTNTTDASILEASGLEDKTGKWITKADLLKEEDTFDMSKPSMFDEKTGKWINYSDLTSLNTTVAPAQTTFDASIIFDEESGFEDKTGKWRPKADLLNEEDSLDMSKPALINEKTGKWINYSDLTPLNTTAAPAETNFDASLIFDEESGFEDKTGKWRPKADFLNEEDILDLGKSTLFDEKTDKSINYFNDMEPIVEPSSDDLEDDWVLVSKTANQPSKIVNINEPVPSTPKKTLKPSVRRPARKAQKALARTVKKPAATTDIHNAGLEAYLKNDLKLLREIKEELRQPTGRVFISSVIGSKPAPAKTAGGASARLAASKKVDLMASVIAEDGKDDLMASVIGDEGAAPEMKEDLEASVVMEEPQKAEAQTWAQYLGWA